MIVIANPHGGGGAARRAVERLLGSWPAGRPRPAVRFTERPGHAEELAAAADAACVVAAGGDGTIHEVVQGLMRHPAHARPRLGLLPAGSGNSLARDLGVLAPGRAREALLTGRDRPLDVAELRWADGTRGHAFNIVGWCLSGEIGRRAEPLRRLGPVRYDVAGVLAILTHRPRHAELLIDGERLEARWSLIHVANTRHTGAGLQLMPQADPGDGAFDVLLVRACPRVRLLAEMARVRLGRGFSPEIALLRRVRRLALHADDPLTTNVDGEIAPSPPVQLDVEPGALRVLA